MNIKDKLKLRAERKKYRQMVRTFTDPILSQVCVAVDRSDDLSWLFTLGKICEACDGGVGLAAPQAGVAKRAVFIFNGRKNGYYMINPVILSQSKETISGKEGCLSYPGSYGEIARHTWIVVEYYNTMWEKKTRRIEGFEAVIVQHEIDHLDGICQVKQFWKKAVEEANITTGYGGMESEGYGGW